MSLTDKQEVFVQEIIKGKTQRESYKVAYSTESMSDKTIDEAASRLFKNSKVAARYDELHSRLVKEAEDECIVTAKQVLKEYAKIGFADIKNYLSFKTALTIIGHDKDGEPIIATAHIVEMKDSDEVEGSVISEVSIKDGALKFKLHDKKGALDSIARHLGMFNDKIEHSGHLTNKIDLSGLSVEDLKAYAKTKQSTT